MLFACWWNGGSEDQEICLYSVGKCRKRHPHFSLVDDLRVSFPVQVQPLPIKRPIRDNLISPSRDGLFEC